MKKRPERQQPKAGFTLIELMICVAIIGVLASVAIPAFSRHKNIAKTAEVKANLAAIRVAQESEFSEFGAYVAAAPEPPAIPGSTHADFDDNASFSALGWSPEGRVYFSYGVVVSADSSGFTADAGADIDGDGIVQLWGYSKPGAGGAVQNGAVGCDVSFLSALELGRCSNNPSIY